MTAHDDIMTCHDIEFCIETKLVNRRPKTSPNSQNQRIWGSLGELSSRNFEKLVFRP